MAGQYHETLVETAAPLPSERSTGFVLAGAAAIAALIWRTEPTIAVGCGATAGVLASLSLMAPQWLRTLNIAWMGLARVLARVMNPIVMFVLFVITIVPFGLLMQLRRDPLRSRPTEADETFWIVPDTRLGPPDMTRQF